jgi:hypothetical protein
MIRKYAVTLLCTSILCITGSVFASSTGLLLRYMSDPKWEPAASGSSKEQTFVRILLFYPTGKFTEVDGWLTRPRGSQSAAFAPGEGYAIRRGHWRKVDDGNIEVNKRLTAEEGMPKQPIPGESSTEIYHRVEKQHLTSNEFTYGRAITLNNEAAFQSLLASSQ